MRKLRIINGFALLGILLIAISYLLLSPPETTPYQVLINRAFGGIVCSILGGILLLIWVWRR